MVDLLMFSSSMKCLFKVFAHFKIGLSILSSYKSPLYNLYIYKSSLGFYTLHIISPSQWLIFTFLMVSFVKLKFKILKSRV